MSAVIPDVVEDMVQRLNELVPPQSPEFRQKKLPTPISRRV